METLNDHLPLSPDLNAERLATIKKLLPDLFSNEGRLNVDELKKLVDPALVSETERYDFRWYGKTKSKREAFTPSRAALVYDPARSVNPGKAGGNMIIEGENLEVLKLLTSAYRERVKCIYFDPPYNKDGDTVYEDDYTEERKPYWEQTGVSENGIRIDTNAESSGRFHSNWLKMIHSRLLIARQLLRNDGVIFVSIDDKEVHNLRRIMDDVFGEENFLSVFVWVNEGNIDNQSKIKGNHEYVIAYARNELDFGAPPVIDPTIPKDSKLFLEYIDNTLVKNGPGNPVSAVRIPVGFPSSMESGVIQPKEHFWPKLSNSVRVENYKTVDEVTTSSGWSSKDILLNFIKNNLEPVKDTKQQDTMFYISQTGAICARKKRLATQSHVLTILRGMGTVQEASSQLLKYGIYFDWPKPVGLLKYLSRVGGDKQGIFLDFFSGSGTLGQAIMELNKDDGGTRQFILVQLPEAIEETEEAYTAGFRKISDMTIKRNERFILGYGDELPFAETGFKVYTLAKSAFPRVEFAPDPAKTEAENIELLKQYIREKEATFHLQFEKDKVLDEVLLKNGFMLDYALTRQPDFKKNEVFLAKDAHKESLLCLDAKLEPETVDHFKTHKDQFFICLELALDTTKKWNLKHNLGEKLKAI
jgi:adenine-specific DNA-methyltransferase